MKCSVFYWNDTNIYEYQLEEEREHIVDIDMIRTKFFLLLEGEIKDVE